jgi:hypothetical protein
LAATLLAGCGGSNGGPSAEGTTTTTVRPASRADFSKLFAGLSKQSFKVTYDDADGNSQSFAQDGKGNTVTAGDNRQVFTTPTTTITCDKADDAATFTCVQSSIRSFGDSPYIASSIAENTYATALAYRFGSTSQKTIAGRDADCFTITAADFGAGSAAAGSLGDSLKGALTYCNDHDTGAVLENTITDEDGDTSTNLLVTEFGQPSASDFDPPATPTIVTVPTITPPGGVGAQ